LAGCHAAVATAMAREQELTGPFAGSLYMVIDRQCDIFGPNGDDITTTKLAIDCQIELDRERGPRSGGLVRMDQTCLGRNGGLAPVNITLFHETRLGAGVTVIDLSWPYSSALFAEGDTMIIGIRVTKSMSGSGQSRLRIKPSGKYPIANDPTTTSGRLVSAGTVSYFTLSPGRLVRLA
jgi:hypothetical protein